MHRKQLEEIVLLEAISQSRARIIYKRTSPPVLVGIAFINSGGPRQILSPIGLKYSERWALSNIINDMPQIFPEVGIVKYYQWWASSNITSGGRREILPTVGIIQYYQWQSSSNITNGGHRRILPVVGIIK